MSPPRSAFLPDGMDDRPIGLIAGKGHYPILMAERIRAAGLPLRVVSFKGETDPPFVESLPRESHIQIKVGQLGKLLCALRKLKCGYAVMAGQITPRRLFHGLHPDLKALALLNRLKIKNAETIFGAIAAEIEAMDIQMLDARSFLDDQMATSGLMTPGRPIAATEYIEHGIRVAKGIAELDIGQGVIVRKGTVLAVEAYEGTDPMLRRAGEFKTDGLIFVKTVKKNQDYRFDVPVFGKRTLDVMAEAKIQTAVLATNQVILLNKMDLLKKAAKYKIELIGFGD